METEYLLRRKQYITAFEQYISTAVHQSLCCAQLLKVSWRVVKLTSSCSGVICSNSPSSRSMKFTLRIQSMMEFTYWYDDVWLCVRVQRRGHNCVPLDTAVILVASTFQAAAFIAHTDQCSSSPHSTGALYFSILGHWAAAEK